MTWVRDGRRYSTDTATEIFSSRVDDQYYGLYWATLYRSPGGRFFAVEQESMTLFDETEDIRRWLERYDAPEDAYAECGIEIVEG